MHRKILLGFILSLLIFPAAFADSVPLRDSHPERYVVVRGDTLWDISARFLENPWQWPEVWHVNPQIENPHLIYPGDVIVLTYVDGKPRLHVERGQRTVKLSPHAREEPLDQAIPTIPIDAIKQFLTASRVVGAKELEEAPYIVDFADDHVIGGAGFRVYVRSIMEEEPGRYTVFRAGETFRDPKTGEILGHEALYVADAALQRTGDPATLMLTKSAREALIGDRLLPSGDEEIRPFFQPRAPGSEVSGQIISVVDGVAQIGQYQIVALSLGEREGLEVGHVLAVEKSGRKIRDTVRGGWRDKVTLPDERSGYVMVFRTYERVSYALVMSATRAIHLYDTVRTP